jgi:hypothetical protein
MIVFIASSLESEKIARLGLKVESQVSGTHPLLAGWEGWPEAMVYPTEEVGVGSNGAAEGVVEDICWLVSSTGWGRVVVIKGGDLSLKGVVEDIH